ncbi:MAG: DciA family protein [Patescibacteria group bacterium]
MGFISLGDIIPKSIKKTGASAQIGEAFMLTKIPKIMARVLGVEIDDRLRLLYVKHQTLTLACVDERLELVIREEEPEILKAIAEVFGPETIKKLQFLE